MMNREILEDVNIAIQSSCEERNWFLSLSQMQTYPEFQAQDLGDLNMRLAESALRLTNHLSDILQKFSFAVDFCSNIIKDLELMLKQHLAEWRQQQKLSCNGYPGFDPEYLNILQVMCDDEVQMTRAILQLRKQIIDLLEFLVNYFGKDACAANIETWGNLSTRIVIMLRSFIETTLVIKIQPSQVIKTGRSGTKFSAEVCSLVARQLLENTDLPPQIQAFIIDEQQANMFVTNGIAPTSNRGEVTLDETESMKYDHSSKQFIAKLKNMMVLEKVQRSERQGSRRVTDEKFAIMFRVTFRLIGNIDIFGNTISLPITAVVHTNQEPRAWGNIFWYNGFSEPGRPLFDTPDVVTWGTLAENLSMKCYSVTGRHLSEEDLNHLALKLNEYEVMENNVIHWSKFCADYLPDKKFSFWEWFYAVLKLIKDHLDGPWKDGRINGFISKQQALTNLRQCVQGTFLLRFSDSVLGGICIAGSVIGRLGPT